MRIDPEVKSILINIRNQLNDDMFKIISILAVPVLAVLLFRIWHTGWSDAMFLQIFAAILVWSLFLFRNRIRPWIKSFVVLTLLFGLGINAIIYYGLPAAGRDYLFVCTILATFFFGLRAGISAFAVSFLFLIGFTVAVANQWLTFSIDYNKYNTAPSSWINLIATWSIFITVVVLSADRLYSALIDSLSTSRQQADKLQHTAAELEEEITERRQAQNALQASERNYRSLAAFYKQLNDISIALTEALGTEDLLKRIADSFRLLTGAIAATFSVCDQNTRVFKVVALSIDPLLSSKINSIFGSDLYEMQMPVSDNIKKEMLSQRIARPKDLCELTFSVMPKEVSDEVMDTIGCKQIVALTISYADELIGTCVAYLPADQPIVPDDALKTYIHLSELSIQHKRAEEDLRESERKARAILNLSFGFIGLLTPEGVILETNTTSLEFIGVKLEDVAGKAFWDTPWWSHSAEMQEKLRTAVLDAAEGKLVRFEATHPGSDGSLRIIDFSLKPVKDDNGKVIYLIPEGRDITERKQAEDELRKNEAIMRSVFNSAPIAVIVIGPDRILRYVVGNTNDIIGYTNEEMMGQTSRFLYFTDEEYRQTGEALYRKAVNENITIEVRMRRKDGNEIWILLSGFPFNPNDPSAGLVVAAIDITARRSIEGRLRQSQKMEAIGQLAGGIAHDFNNILTAILGYTDMVLFDLEPEDKNSEKLMEVNKAAKRAAALTKQLLAFSRRQVLQLAPLNLNQTIEDILKMVRRLIGENIDLTFMPNQEIYTINADRSQVEQVILNLCLNARDAMPDGGRLSIETGNSNFDASYCAQYDWAKPGRYVFLSITDSGSGIDNEKKGKIFEPFFTTKESGKGTGLGLATVYGIVRQHNGGIQVYSDPGKGSKFTVYLPAIEREETISTSQAEEYVTGGHETILLAEDNEQVRQIALSFLQNSGYKVHLAVDGEDALRVYKEHGAKIDLLLLDVVMPKKGGRSVYEEIRTTHPDIKCLFISGYSVNAVHTNFILDQGLHLIQKPFKKDDLLRTIRLLLDQALYHP